MEQIVSGESKLTLIDAERSSVKHLQETPSLSKRLYQEYKICSQQSL